MFYSFYASMIFCGMHTLLPLSRPERTANGWIQLATLSDGAIAVETPCLSDSYWYWTMPKNLIQTPLIMSLQRRERWYWFPPNYETDGSWQSHVPYRNDRDTFLSEIFASRMYSVVHLRYHPACNIRRQIDIGGRPPISSVYSKWIWRRDDIGTQT